MHGANVHDAAKWTCAEFHTVTQEVYSHETHSFNVIIFFFLMWALLIKLGLNAMEKTLSPHGSFFVLVQIICCHSATLWHVREEHQPVQSARLPAWNTSPGLSGSLRCGDWHSGGRGLSASCTGHYSLGITWGCLDPHCQHINLSVSWIHQGLHCVADAVMDNCCASFLCSRFFPFYWSTSRSLSAAFLPRILSRVSTQMNTAEWRLFFEIDWNVLVYPVNFSCFFFFSLTNRQHITGGFFFHQQWHQNNSCSLCDCYQPLLSAFAATLSWRTAWTLQPQS